MKKLNNEIFKERLIKNYDNRYDYSKVDYVDYNTNVCIICPEHGDFYATPSNLLYKNRKNACPKCSIDQNADKQRLTEKEIIEKIKEVHQIDLQVRFKHPYKNNRDKIEVLCPEHGWFSISVSNICNGQFCPKCGNIKISRKNKNGDEAWRERINKISQNRVILCEDEVYDHQTKKCRFICPIHGEFYCTIGSVVNSLKKGNNGCNRCKRDKLRQLHTSSWEETLKEMNLKHNFKYEYDRTTYIDKRSKIKIICPIHGEFWQTPKAHIRGQGCPMCKESYLEQEIRNLLNNNNISFISQHTFEWLKNENQLYLDFYLPEHNIAIECQGIQHFETVDYFGGEEGLKIVKERDKIKFDLCKKRSIKILYYNNLNYDLFLGENILHNVDEVLTILND